MRVCVPRVRDGTTVATMCQEGSDERSAMIQTGCGIVPRVCAGLSCACARVPHGGMAGFFSLR